jgi:hypothetical protein
MDNDFTFLRTSVADFRAFTMIVNYLGLASTLHTNLNKYSTHLIHCSEEEVILVDHQLQCPMQAFPLCHLGLPLGLRKQTMARLQYLLDSVAKPPPNLASVST